MIPLSKFLSELRRELNEARAEAEAVAALGDGVVFAAKSTEIEIAITAEMEGGGNGKVSFKVLGSGVEFGGSAKVGNTAMHRLKMQLDPVDVVTGEAILVSRSAAAPAPRPEPSPAHAPAPNDGPPGA